MTREEYLADMWDFYSDVHKDAYGFRPRGEQVYNWFISLTKEQMDYQFALMQETILDEERQRRTAQEDASIAFEERVEEVIRAGAGDRATALRWIHDAEGTNGDWEFLCYCVGVPYGYFRKDAA